MEYTDEILKRQAELQEELHRYHREMSPNVKPISNWWSRLTGMSRKIQYDSIYQVWLFGRIAELQLEIEKLKSNEKI